MTAAAQSIVIDQSKIRFYPHQQPKSGFPRPLAWWRRFVPCWLTVSEDEQGRIVLEPSGRRADGVVFEVTPQVRRRDLRQAREWLARLPLDFSDALLTPNPDVPEGGAR